MQGRLLLLVDTHLDIEWFRFQWSSFACAWQWKPGQRLWHCLHLHDSDTWRRRFCWVQCWLLIYMRLIQVKKKIKKVYKGSTLSYASYITVWLSKNGCIWFIVKTRTPDLPGGLSHSGLGGGPLGSMWGGGPLMFGGGKRGGYKTKENNPFYC